MVWNYYISYIKHIIYISIIFLTSCRAEESKVVDKDVARLVKETESFNDTMNTVETPKNGNKDLTRNFTLKEMPTIWILLSEEDGSLVIIDSWDSQGEQIEFEKGKGNDWSMNISYPQDTESGIISEFNATITESEISIVTGSFVFTSIYDNTPRKITFKWNQMARLCEFTNIGLGSEHFTPEGSEDFFETIVYEREED